MVCWELFEEQPEKYREEVLPPSVTARLSVEAASTQVCAFFKLSCLGFSNTTEIIVWGGDQCVPLLDPSSVAIMIRKS